MEVIVLPTEEKEIEERENIESIVQSLVGALPYTDKSLSELQEERLRKYEITD